MVGPLPPVLRLGFTHSFPYVLTQIYAFDADRKYVIPTMGLLRDHQLCSPSAAAVVRKGVPLNECSSRNTIPFLRMYSSSRLFWTCQLRQA